MYKEVGEGDGPLPIRCPPWAWSSDSALSPRGHVSGSRTGAVPTWETSDHIDKSYQVDLGLLSTYSVLR